MRYSLIREMDISNGDGVGVSLFVQGCHFHCRGCFNPETWDFSGGYEWNDNIENKFMELVSKPYAKRVSFLGGEPLADENVEIIYYIIQKIKALYPEKKIWIFTGYTWENIFNQSFDSSQIRMTTVALADIVADGQFQIAQQDINHKQALWVGSLNQRVIDVKESLKTNNIILYKGVKNDTR